VAFGRFTLAEAETTYAVATVHGIAGRAAELIVRGSVTRSTWKERADTSPVRALMNKVEAEMEDPMAQPVEADRAPPASQQATVRQGGQAAGGVDPAPGDPTSQHDAQEANEDARQEMRRRGFGDHKGGDIG
jgi:hypothetical protein